MKRVPSKSQLNSFSSDEEEVDEVLQELVYAQQTPKYSLAYSLLRYPLLAFCIWIIAFHLCIYLILRQVVAILDYLSSFWTVHQKLKGELQRSGSYYRYFQTALLLDKELGLNEWKCRKLDEHLFDEALIVRTTARLHKARVKDQNVKQVASILKSACRNDLGGVENKKLYNRSFAGTKNTIDSYVNEVALALEFVGTSEAIDSEEKLKLFDRLAVIFGKTALCLSGGAILVWYHLGVAKALLENGLLPNIITGSSAGSLIAAIIGTRNDDELRVFFNDPTVLDKLKFMNNNFLAMIKSLLQRATLTFQEELAEAGMWLTKGHITFLEAYQHTGRCLNICVMANEPNSKFRSLNYITAPHVTILSAVAASSALTFVKSPGKLFQKDARGNIIPFNEFGETRRDGSMNNDIPLSDLQTYFNVKYTIVSQTNPHISLFLLTPKGHVGTHTINGYRGGFIVAAILRYTLLEISKWLRLVKTDF